ncbi:MAG TPA: phosphotransferase, partial [Terriglobia bacterium]|nr:phosphotransferase [Terriglobia bacterium]
NASRADPSFRRRFRDRKVFDQLRIDPYYRTTAARHPDVRPAIEELIRRSLRIRQALVHGDYSPKNILVRGGRIFLIDFEVVHWGDPTFDFGFLLNHLFLKAFHQPRFADVYFGAAREFWQATLTASGAYYDALEEMTLRHLGALMLARIDGKSPVEYISDEATKERVRRTAKRILLDPPASLTGVIRRVQDEIT